jgi:hypothetical protein
MGQGKYWKGSGRSLNADLTLKRNKTNRYLQDRSTFDVSFSGLGPDFLIHDTCAIEGPGPIEDRTQEHLGYTDQGIIDARRQLLRAIEAVQRGGEAPGVVRDPRVDRAPNLVVRSDALLPASVDWHHYWSDDRIVPELTTAGHD